MNARVRGSATLSSAFVVVAFGVFSASAQLNPTVKVLPKPQMTVPPECEQGLAPAVPRVIVAEAATEETKPAKAAPPPSLDLKTQLRTVQVAAERGDRDAFKAALTDARAAVARYPAGGERNAANEVVSVYNDLERLWDYQFTSPTGAFFDSSTDFVGMMRRYPAYSAAIADQTLTVSGQTMYPTAETRQFLVAEAARRLDRLGVRTPTRITEVTPPPVAAPQPKVVPPPVPRRVPEKPAVRKAEHAPPHAAPHVATHKATKKPRPKPVKVAEARKPTPAPTPQPKQSAAPPRPATTTKTAAEGRGATTSPQPKQSVPPPTPMSTPQPKSVTPPPMPVSTPQPKPIVAPPPPAATATAAEGRGATTSPQPKSVSLPPIPVSTPQPKQSAPPPPAATESATPPMPTDTMSSTTTTSGPTETTGTTATTSTAPAQNPTPAGGRMNLLFAIILIIVGIGVLIVLFRASD